MADRHFWIWPLRVNRSTRDRFDAFLSRFDLLLRPSCWIPVSLFAGLAPIGFCVAVGCPYHPAMTAFFLLPLLACCVRADRSRLAIVSIGMVVGIHVVSVIALTVAHAEKMEPILSGSQKYWEKTLHWIITGEDVTEYRPRDWLPEHVLLLIGVCALSYSSFGFIPLAVGIQQLDLMNYYVARLILRSDHPATMLALGWHPWSFLRGLAYSILIFETVSASLERLLGRPLSTRKRRITRWILGIGFAVADVLVKWQFAEPIREILNGNLNHD